MVSTEGVTLPVDPSGSITSGFGSRRQFATDVELSLEFAKDRKTASSQIFYVNIVRGEAGA
jgi:hypothetical protein